jgi:hypothetical protein
MSNAVINGNVVNLTITSSSVTLNLVMSLQRHHYRYCGTGNGLAMNSLLYALVTDQQVLDDVREVGQAMEGLLNNNHRPQVLFGVEFKTRSNRVYMVDNAALNPNGLPNHFFPTKGPSLWSNMTQNEYVAASAIRRVEEAINNKNLSERNKFLDVKQVHNIRFQTGGGGAQNPVILAYVAAQTALGQVLNADQNLVLVSNCKEIVTVARQLY